MISYSQINGSTIDSSDIYKPYITTTFENKMLQSLYGPPPANTGKYSGKLDYNFKHYKLENDFLYINTIEAPKPKIYAFIFFKARDLMPKEINVTGIYMKFQDMWHKKFVPTYQGAEIDKVKYKLYYDSLEAIISPYYKTIQMVLRNEISKQEKESSLAESNSQFAKKTNTESEERNLPAANTQQILVKDIDGNSYKPINLGSQTWFAENLRVRSYSNGDPIPYFTDNKETYPRKGVYVQFEDNSRAYNWYSVVDGRGLCPTGWRVPTKADWERLRTYLGSGVEIKLKSNTAWGSQYITTGGFYSERVCTNCLHWSDYKRETVVCPVCNDKRRVRGDWVPEKRELVNYNGNNSSGFNAKPFIGMHTVSNYEYEAFFEEQSGYWSSTLNEKPGTRNSFGYTEAFSYLSSGMDIFSEERIDSFLGVRCLKDE